MQAEMLGHGVLGLVMLTTLIWIGLLPADLALRVAEFLLGWTALSTLVVGCAGAWVAIGRSRR